MNKAYKTKNPPSLEGFSFWGSSASNFCHPAFNIVYGKLGETSTQNLCAG